MQMTTETQLYRNEFLFAQAYLERLLLDKYDKTVLDALGQTIKEWRKSKKADSAVELLNSYIGPVLDSLHFVRQNEPSFAGGARLLPYWGAETPVGAVLVIDPESRIDCTTKGHNWAEKLVRFMRACGAGWGVLTDGEIWRLYRRDELAPYDTFLEVSLGAAIDARDVDALRIFHRFFTADAFVVDKDDQPMLETYRQASIKATQEIERHLKSSMDDVLRNICLGFVRDEGRNTFSQSERDDIFNNSVYLLYRVVFILYAESRGLLPVSNTVYSEQYSLKTLTREAVEHHFKRTIDPTGTDLWVRLRKLFVWIDEGHRATPEEDFDITEYDGELFDSYQRPYLSEHLISNEFLAEAIYQLNCIDDPKRPGDHRWIDYRDLSVRHLGSLYESLLEYKLYIAAQPMVARVSGDKVQYVPQAGVQLKESDRGSLIPAGGAYFGQSPTERKRSGSYYTPEDVVDYIVSNTVCKGLENIWEQFKPELERLLSDVRSAISDDERKRLQRFVDESVEKFVRNQVFTYRILDPAMGSGHFLVNALQKVTNFIVEKLNETPWNNEALDTSPGGWRRRTVERCIFGVDINPLATELAKLSLWLASASEGKPLSFLNHHLKTGNSLIGARISDLNKLPDVKEDKATNSLPFYVNETLALVLSEYQGIAAQDSDGIDAVEDKKRRDKHIGEILTRVRDVANVWISTFYGNAVTAEQYEWLQQLATQNYGLEQWDSYMSDKSWTAYARRLSMRERFFHWEVEFAEAKSWDAIIGNPPYVEFEAIPAIKHLYHSADCKNLYALFLEKSLQLGGIRSQVGQIVPLSLPTSGDMAPIRSVLFSKRSVRRLYNFDNNPDRIFNEGTLRNGQRATVILQALGTPEDKTYATDLLRWRTDERRRLFDNLECANVTAVSSDDIIPMLGKEPLVHLFERITGWPTKVAGVVSKGGSYPIYAPKAPNYFITILRQSLDRKYLSRINFATEEDQIIALLLFNSNIFYWYWRVVADGLDLYPRDMLRFFFPVEARGRGDATTLLSRLETAAPNCTTYYPRLGKVIPNVNFNKRMDILLDIDDWILRYLAPDLELPRGIFAQYKSNSLLRPLDLSSMAEEPEGD